MYLSHTQSALGQSVVSSGLEESPLVEVSKQKVKRDTYDFRNIYAKNTNHVYHTKPVSTESAG